MTLWESDTDIRYAGHLVAVSSQSGPDMLAPTYAMAYSPYSDDDNAHCIRI